MRISCDCGRVINIPFSNVFGMFGGNAQHVDKAKRRLVCKRCFKKRGGGDDLASADRAAMARDRLLVDALEGNRHVNIRCRCHRTVTVRSRALINAMGEVSTVRKAQSRLVCSQWTCKGWATIKPAER